MNIFSSQNFLISKCLKKEDKYKQVISPVPNELLYFDEIQTSKKQIQIQKWWINNFSINLSPALSFLCGPSTLYTLHSASDTPSLQIAATRLFTIGWMLLQLLVPLLSSAPLRQMTFHHWLNAPSTSCASSVFSSSTSNDFPLLLQKKPSLHS